MTAASGTAGAPAGPGRAGRVRIGRLVLWSVNTIVCLFLLAPILVVIVASFSRDAYLAFPRAACPSAGIGSSWRAATSSTRCS